MTIFTGSATALVSPFTDNGINYSAFEKQLEFQIENGTSALVVCGTTGEPSTMPKKEKTDLIKFAVKQSNNRVPIIAGTGGNNTKSVIEDSLKAQDSGADALLIVLPYYNQTTQKGLIEHYTTIAENVELPIIIYNVPSRTKLNMEPKTLSVIAKHERIVAIKEASGDLRQVQEMVRLCGDNIDMYSGDDFVVLPMLACGAKGVISVVANITPKESVILVESYMSGDISKARMYQNRLNALTNALFCEVNPIPVKTAMNLLGMEAGKLRLPLCEMEEKNKKVLIDSMIEFGFKL